MSTHAFDSIAAGLNDAIAHAESDSAKAIEHRVVPIDVRAIRDKLKMSQSAFADAFGVSIATVRNWEQGRRAPRGPARVLLHVINQEPEAVQRALAGAV
ncbi:MAG: putative transcriptional regulator [Myxococcota bacterium]|jgi:putative transcriptional regulator